jgi:cytochrome c oxidase subunit 1
VTGVFLSDVPVDVTVHGSFFVLAHFHYTIMGGLIFAFFAGLYFWLPKMTGKTLNKRLGKIHFWCMFVFFNMTFFPMFLIGILGQPRRVFEYAQNLQALNDFASVSAFLLGASSSASRSSSVIRTTTARPTLLPSPISVKASG